MKKYLISYTHNPGLYIALSEDGRSAFNTMNPNVAKKFSSIKSAKHWIKESSTLELDEFIEFVSLESASSKFDKWISGGMHISPVELKNKLLSRKYDGEGPLDVLGWWLGYSEYFDNCGVRYEDYVTWPKLNEKFTYLHDVRHHEGLSNNIERSFSFYFPKEIKHSVDIFIKELNLVKDHITYLDKDGNLIISVFDHYLSEHGNSVNIIWTKENKFIVTRYSYSVLEEGSVEKIFNYLVENRWY